MRNMKLKSVIAVAVIGSVVLAQAAVVWTGGTGDWSTGANWAGGVVPDISGTDDAQISTGGAATYTPGGDLKFEHGSDLILDGGSLTQATNGDWFQVNYESTFTITSGGLLDVRVANNFSVGGKDTGSATNTMNNGTLLMKTGVFDDLRAVEVSNGSIITVDQLLTLQAGSHLDLTDSTLTMRNFALRAWAGKDTFLNIYDDAQVNLMNTGSLGTGVIIKEGGSMVNFAAGSTGSMFIDNLSVADLETMIGEGKFGVDGSGSTTLTDYNYSVSGSGVTMAIPEPATLGMVVAFGGGMLFIRRKMMM